MASKASVATAALMLWLVLAVWAQLPAPLRDWLALPCWLILLGFCWRSMNEQALLRRRVWLDQYLQPDAPFHRWLRGGILLRLFNLVVAVLLSGYLLVKMLSLTPSTWYLLLASAVTFTLCLSVFERGLRPYIQPSRLAPLTRRLALLTTAGVLILSYCVIVIYTPQPLLIARELTEALALHRPPLADNASLLMMADQLVRGSELFGWWALQNSLGSTSSGGTLSLIGWAVLLLSGAAFLWTWCHIMQGIASGLERAKV
ncbi:MAG: hypothetical protein LAT63_09340 [Marinobacter sp.]|nr:hypothetical protein [Marinobacter sp.]